MPSEKLRTRQLRGRLGLTATQFEARAIDEARAKAMAPLSGRLSVITGLAAAVVVGVILAFTWPSMAPLYNTLFHTRPTVVAPAHPLTAAELDAREATAAPTGAPLLWKLQKDKATVYLFGSIHVLKSGLDWMDPRLFAAFDNADEAWFELADLEAEPQGLKLPTGQALDSRPVLANGLTETEKAQLERLLNPYNLTIADVARMKPWAMANAIQQLDEMGGGFSDDKGVDDTLFHRAKMLKKTVGGFESTRLHYSYLTALTGGDEKDDGTARLKKMLAAHFGTGSGNDDLHAMVRQWRSGDSRSLTANILEEKANSPRQYDTLLVRRNRLWVPQIEKMLAGNKTIFVTVGTAHMFGPDGLLAQLRARGYTVTRVDP